MITITTKSLANNTKNTSEQNTNDNNNKNNHNNNSDTTFSFERDNVSQVSATCIRKSDTMTMKQ